MSAILVSLLMDQLNKENAQKLLGFLGERLGNKPIELEVEANSKQLR